MQTVKFGNSAWNCVSMNCGDKFCHLEVKPLYASVQLTIQKYSLLMQNLIALSQTVQDGLQMSKIHRGGAFPKADCWFGFVPSQMLSTMKFHPNPSTTLSYHAHKQTGHFHLTCRLEGKKNSSITSNDYLLLNSVKERSIFASPPLQ